MRQLIFAFLLVGTTAFGMNRESGGMMAPAGIWFDFQSVGSGVDQKTLSYLEGVLQKAQSEGKLNELVQKSYGVEGETMVCVRFADYWDSLNFYNQIETLLVADIKASGYQRTKLYAGPNCRDFTQAQEQSIPAKRRSGPL